MEVGKTVWLIAAVAAVIILVVLIILAAGAYGMFKNGKEVETKRDAQGNVILLDTPRMREFAAYCYDQTIEMEKQGHQMSNGMSWNERWLGTIRSIRQNTDNPEWYVQYIIEQRRKAGLPELEGVD